MNAPLPAKATLLNKLSSRFSVDETKLMTTLKATAFKVKDGTVSDEQMTALMVVADQYGLNPFTRELFAFPDKQNGIVPVVSVDGWSRIINEHGALDGIEFRYSEKMDTMTDAKPCPEWCEVLIRRKDRAQPIIVREYLDEVYRVPFKGKDGYTSKGPWQTHTKRFLRHKTLIQGARIAFGFGGIYDEDEAQRIIESDVIDGTATRIEEKKPAELPVYSAESFGTNFPAWEKLIQSGKRSASDIITMVSSKAILSDEQRKKIEAVKVAEILVTYAQVAEKLNAAKDVDVLNADADLIREVKDEQQRAELSAIYQQRLAQFKGE
jgi:phage recombination protein Bet